MKHTTTRILIAFAFAGFVSLANAEDKKTEEHSAHHPADQSTEAKTDGKNEMGMMGNMDMTQMHAMMDDCTKMHKNSKMCDQEMMGTCKKQMSKGDCMKMMKKVKAENKMQKK